MAVNRQGRDDSIAAIAAFMRGDIHAAEVRGIRDRIDCGRGDSCDLVLMDVWSERSPLWGILRRRERIAARPEEWEYLRRCTAILNTSIDWTFPESRVDGWREVVMLIPAIGSIVAMIVGANVLNGWPIIIWTIVGIVVVPVCLIIMLMRDDPQCVAPYPFASIERYEEVAPSISQLRIPEYTRSLHGCSWLARCRLMAPYTVLVMLVVVFLVALWPIAIFGLFDREDEQWHIALARSAG